MSKARLIFDGGLHSINSDERQVLAVIAGLDAVITRTNELAAEPKALDLPDEFSYVMLNVFSKRYNRVTNTFSTSDLSIVEELEALGMTLRGDKNLNAEAWLKTFLTILKLVCPTMDRSSGDATIAALTEEINSLQPPELDDDDYAELNVFYLQHKATLEDSKRIARFYIPIYACAALYFAALRKGGLSKAGTSTILKNFGLGTIDANELVRLMREASALHFRYPEATARIEIRSLASDTKDVIEERELIAFGTISADLENLVTGVGTIATYLNVLAIWAGPVNSMSASTSPSKGSTALYARGSGGYPPCPYCKRNNHPEERCWKKMRDEGRHAELPPEAQEGFERKVRVFANEAAHEASKVEHEREGIKVLQRTTVKPQADQCGAAVKNAMEPHMSAHGTWTEAKRQILLRRVRELVFEVAAM
jgi:hypothetical protein